MPPKDEKAMQERPALVRASSRHLNSNLKPIKEESSGDEKQEKKKSGQNVSKTKESK